MDATRHLLGVILAGGQSRRMGRDKAFLPLNGRPLLAHVTRRLTAQVASMAISANGDPARFAPFGLPVLADSLPGHPGPLAGVLAGLDHAAGLGIGHVLTVAVDTPFCPTDLGARLHRAAAGGLALAATPGAGGSPDLHPTCGLWPVGLRADLRAALAGGTRRVTEWTRAQDAQIVLFHDAAAFFNINTPDDLSRAADLMDR